MRKLTSILKHLGLGALLAGIPLLGGCSGATMTWQEEVKLLDGRTIVVTQKRRYEQIGSVVRESWLSFQLPETGNKKIVWHENLKPRILNIYGGKVYVIGWPPTIMEFRLFGEQNPPYYGYRYEGGKWARIPFAEIPEAIYDTNLWIENEPPNPSKLTSFSDKEKEMKDRSIPKEIKRIDPQLKY